MSQSRKKNNSGRKKNHLHIFVVLAAAALLLILAVITENRASTEKVDLEAYFASAKGSVAVIRDCVLTHEDMITEDGHVYISETYLTEKLNSRFYYDRDEQLLLYSLPEKTISADRKTQFGGVYILKFSDGAAYVLLDYAARYTNMSWTLYTDPLRVVIRTDFGDRKVMQAAKDVVIRRDAGLKYPIMATLPMGDSAVILDERSEWYYVCTDDGIHGFAAKEDVTAVKTASYPNSYEEPVYPVVCDRQDICLVWDLIGTEEDNAGLEGRMAQTQGVTTVSPTWFHLSDKEGNISSTASEAYVRKAHAMGLDVWILFNNMDYEVYGDDLTALLASTSRRKKMVSALVSETQKLGADGINLDFESVPSAAGKGYIQFVRELALACHANGLVLSVDNYVPSAWTAHYDRAEQGVFADYVIIMGYDEHYLGSEAGSTASLSFVTKGIADTLEQVPAEKVINAVPFYSRLWKGVGESLESSVLTMQAMKDYLANYELSTIWDNELGQNYVEFIVENVQNRIWLEDASSMTARLAAIKEYHLAGLAAWRLGLETADIWDVISAYCTN